MQVSYGCRQTPSKIGVLIAQLGTPDAPTPSALKRYLKQFLSDPRVIEVNKYLWWFILNGIILNTRPKRSAQLYARVWTDKGSPLLLLSESQAQKCREGLARNGIEVECIVGMRYGNPSLESAVDTLIDRGCDRILLFPMYPQYAAATTASSYDAVFAHLLKKRSVPTLKVLAPYFNRVEYIDALVSRFREYWNAQTIKPERIILSYHGVPLEYVRKGDPYCCQCRETTAHFIQRSGLNPEIVVHTYQSRFGKDPWINPYTDETLESLARQGVKHVAVMCPGFTADCLETIDEIGHEAKETFIHAGGESLSLIPCVNDHQDWIAGMISLIREELAPWISSKILSPACNACTARTQ